MITTYIVHATFPNHPRYAERVMNVQITEGYTEFEDIRKIIATKYGMKPTDIKVMSVTDASTL